MLSNKIGKIVDQFETSKGYKVLIIKRDASPFEGREFCTIAMDDDNANNLFWGHYDMTLAEAVTDAAARI